MGSQLSLVTSNPVRLDSEHLGTRGNSVQGEGVTGVHGGIYIYVHMKAYCQCTRDVCSLMQQGVCL